MPSNADFHDLTTTTKLPWKGVWWHFEDFEKKGIQGFARSEGYRKPAMSFAKVLVLRPNSDIVWPRERIPGTMS